MHTFSMDARGLVKALAAGKLRVYSFIIQGILCCIGKLDRVCFNKNKKSQKKKQERDSEHLTLFRMMQAIVDN